MRLLDTLLWEGATAWGYSRSAAAQRRKDGGDVSVRTRTKIEQLRLDIEWPRQDVVSFVNCKPDERIPDMPWNETTKPQYTRPRATES